MIGMGSDKEILAEEKAAGLLKKALMKQNWSGKRVLLVLPDFTRTAPVPFIFKTIYDLIGREVARFDGVVALGTHQPLPADRILKRVGLSSAEYREKYAGKTAFFNHEWDNSAVMVRIGTIRAEEARRITGGIINRDIPIEVNRLLFGYDHILVAGPVFPHEVAGFSGGNKYFFPGVAGEKFIHMFHWLGAIITNAVINGSKETPVRALIDYAARFIKVPRTYVHLVMHYAGLHGLYIGDGCEAWEKAADLSARLNIHYVDRTYRQVLGVAPEKYEDIWTAGKVAYKAETIVADGGDLIIYAPHITEVSVTHGRHLEEIGYHVRDYYLNDMKKYAHIPGGILAHSTHVKGAGSFENGIEKPRINVILATGIPEETCRRINLGYLDPAAIRLADWQNREPEGILFIPEAGEILYKLR
ncbi:MAG: lactate racemase domain-containing protein [Bacillota bacterium]